MRGSLWCLVPDTGFSPYELFTILTERSLSLFLFLIDTKVVYRRYASLFFVCGISSGDNELATLEIVHRYVEVLDRYFGNVSPLPSHLPP